MFPGYFLNQNITHDIQPLSISTRFFEIHNLDLI